MSLKRSVIFTWFLSYLLILFIPILVAGVNYINTRKIIENEINKSSSFLLGRLKQQMDSILSGIDRLTLEISFNSKVKETMEFEGQPSGLEQYTIAQAVKDLNLLKLSKDSIYDFYVYFSNIDTILTGSASTDSKTFYRSMYEFDEGKYDKWLDALKHQHSSEYYSVSEGLNGTANGRIITYIRSIPYAAVDKIIGNIVITIDESRFFIKDAEGINLTGMGSVAVIDGSNKVISHIGNIGLFERSLINMLKERQGLIHENIQGEKVVISYIKSDISGWKYVSVIPSSVFWEKAEDVRKSTVLSLLACIVIGLVLSLALIKWNYNPLKKLVKFTKNSSFPCIDRKVNEYGFIQKAMDETYSEKNKMSSILKQQNKVLRSVSLARLLKGSGSIEIPIDEMLGGYDIKLDSDRYAVMVFFIEKYDNIPLPENASRPDDEYRLIQFVMTNVFEELIGRRNKGYVTEVDGMIACLVSFSDKVNPEWKEELLQAVNEAGDFLEKHYGIVFQFSVSSIHETMIGIAECYLEALKVMEYKRILDRRELVFYDELAVTMKKGDFYYPLEKEHQLINCIRIGDFVKAKAILDDIFRMNTDNLIISLDAARCLMFDLVSTLIKAMNEIDGVNQGTFFNEINPVQKLLNCNSMNEMRFQMTNMLDEFCGIIREKSKNSQLKDKIVSYVHSNYNKDDLNIASIARQFGMNPDYISREFREYFSEGLLDYITRIRIDKAKKLLLQGLRLEDVAQAIGYSNVRTFIRSFVKCEGVTPGKYRNIN